jgi:penicillin amidase
VHALTYRHLFSSASKLLGFALDRDPIELPGDTFTVNVAAYSLRAGTFEVDEIPSARLIVDLGSPDRSRLVLPIGESGQLADSHADDQLAAWAAGRDFPFPFTAAAVDAETVSTLRLVP